MLKGFRKMMQLRGSAPLTRRWAWHRPKEARFEGAADRHVPRHQALSFPVRTASASLIFFRQRIAYAQFTHELRTVHCG